jgi:Amino acid synthesis
MEIRRTLVVKDTVSFEGGAPAIVPVTRVAACAVIANPLAGVVTDDLQALVPFGAELGAYLVRTAADALQAPVLSYGKGAIVGTAGDIEHAAAIILHEWESLCAMQSAVARPSFHLTSK